jgi:hypothetical protein
MEANTKKRIIIWTSVSAILGVGGYFLYKYLKDKGIIGKNDKGDTGSTGGQNTGGGAENQVVQPSVGSQPTAEQTALATAYRIWANSTDALNKKYGKKSQYDLDATRTNPYGGTFLKSYAAGKTEYEASLKPSGTTATTGKQDQIEQITKIAARYKAPIEAHTKGGQMVSLFFGAKFQGENKAYRVRVYEKNPNSGTKDTNGNLIWVLFQADWSTFSSYESLSYTAISLGYLRYDNGKFVGANTWGVGVGAKGNSNMITQFIQQVTNNQIYGVFDTSKLQ